MEDRRDFVRKVFVPGLLLGGGYPALSWSRWAGGERRVSPSSPGWTGAVRGPGREAAPGVQLEGVHSVLAYGAVADGKTDDTEAIQKTLDAGAGGAVWFPPGEYRVRPLRVHGNTHVRLAQGAVVRLAEGTQSDRAIFESRGANRILLEGGKLDGNAFQQTARNDLIRLREGEGHRVHGMRLVNAARHGVFLSTCRSTSITDCHILGYGSGHLGFGVLFFMGSEDCVAYGNRIRSGGQSNVGVACDAGTTGSTAPKPSMRCTVSYNDIGDTGEGIVVEGSDDCVIHDNRIGDVEVGIRLSKDQGDAVTDRCVVKGNRIQDARRHGIVISVGSGHLLSGNLIAGKNSDITGIDIRAQQGVPIHELIVEGNVVRSVRNGITCRPLECDITHLQLSNNLLLSCREHGVYVNTHREDGGGVRLLDVKGNYIADPAGTGVGVGIRIENRGYGVRDATVGFNTIRSVGEEYAGDRSFLGQTIYGTMNFAIGRGPAKPDTVKEPTGWIEVKVDGMRRFVPAYE